MNGHGAMIRHRRGCPHQALGWSRDSRWGGGQKKCNAATLFVSLIKQLGQQSRDSRCCPSLFPRKKKRANRGRGYIEEIGREVYAFNTANTATRAPSACFGSETTLFQHRESNRDPTANPATP
jgi:hypothetical protein